MKTPFPNENAEYQAFVAENPDNHLQRLADGTLLVLTGEDLHRWREQWDDIPQEPQP